MKLVTLSLVAMITMGTASFASDSLADAFQNGTLKGEARAYYFDKDNDQSDAKSADLLTLALRLAYKTAEFNGFKAGFTFQGSNSPWADDSAKSVLGKHFDLYGSGAQLSEAYLQYTLANTEFKAGRMFMYLPLMKGNASRVVLESFEGATIVNTDLPQTVLSFGYAQKAQSKTDGNGNIAEFKKFAYGDYAYSVAAVNKSIQGLTLTAAYGEQDNYFDLLFSEMEYKRKSNQINYGVSAQYNATNYDTSANDADMYSVKLDGDYNGFNAYAAYSDISDGTVQCDVVNTGDIIRLYTSTLTYAGIHNASEQYAFDVGYKFASLGGLSINARYVNIEYTEDGGALANDKEDYSSFYSVYKFKGALKGLLSIVQYEQRDSNNDANDENQFRVRAIYKF